MPKSRFIEPVLDHYFRFRSRRKQSGPKLAL